MKKLILVFFILNLSCASSNESRFIKKFINSNPNLLKTLKNNDIQLKLTVIDSNENFNEYEYN